MPNQWNFTSATLNRIRFVFYHNNQDNERNICQDLLTIGNINSDLKVHALHYANELPVRVRLSFQNLLQTHSTWRNNTKKMFKSRDHYKPLLHSYVFMFFTTISTPKKMRVFFQSARWKRHCATHWREQRGKDSSNFWLVRSEHAHASYPGLSFRSPGFSTYRGREERRVQGLDYVVIRGNKRVGNRGHFNDKTLFGNESSLHTKIAFTHNISR